MDPWNICVSWWALEDGTNTLSQNLRNKPPINTMKLPGKAKTSTYNGQSPISQYPVVSLPNSIYTNQQSWK
jgi:hypothetical protein